LRKPLKKVDEIEEDGKCGSENSDGKKKNPFEGQKRGLC